MQEHVYRKMWFRILLGLVIFLSLIVLLMVSFDYFHVDKCLDGGGRLNYETNECEY